MDLSDIEYVIELNHCECEVLLIILFVWMNGARSTNNETESR